MKNHTTYTIYKQRPLACNINIKKKVVYLKIEKYAI